MIKSVLISIQPQHLVNILNGKKTLELRKTVPKNYKGWVYIYCTKNGDNLVYNGKSYQLEKGKKLDYDLNGKVVARFWLDDFTTYSIEKPVNNLMTLELKNENRLFMDRYTQSNLIKESCLDIKDIWEYARPNKKNPDKQRWIIAWHIKNLEIFDTPKELSKFYKNDSKWSKHYKTWERLKDEALEKYILKRPPQGWQYIFSNETGEEHV